MHSPIVSTIVQCHGFAGRCSGSVREGCDPVVMRCHLLIVIGCEVPGYYEATKEMAHLEVKVRRGLASRDDVDRFRTMLSQWQPVIDLLDAIFGASYFCEPIVRTVSERMESASRMR